MRLIASTNAILGADEACAMLCISRDATYRLAKDPDDLFPIHYIDSKTCDGIVLHDELVAWVERNRVVGTLRRGIAPMAAVDPRGRDDPSPHAWRGKGARSGM